MMFSLFSKKKQIPALEGYSGMVESFVNNNPIVIWCENKDYDNSVKLSYDESTKSYMLFIAYPVLDDTGNCIENALANYSISPSFAILDNRFYTERDFEEIKFQNTKTEQLKILIDKIEKL